LPLCYDAFEKNLLMLLLAIIGFAEAHSQQPLSIEMESDLRITALLAETKSDGSKIVYLLGRRGSTFFLSKINASGRTVEWTAELPFFQHNTRARYMSFSLDGNSILILSQRENFNTANITRIGTDGELISTDAFKMPFNFRNASINKSDDHYIVHTSRTLSAFAFDDSGSVLWANRYIASGFTQLHNGSSDKNGGIFMYKNNGNHLSPQLIHIDKNGDVNHHMTVDFSSHRYSQIQDVTVDNQGNMIILGYRNNFGSGGNATGNQENYTAIIASFSLGSFNKNWERTVELSNGSLNADGWRGSLQVHDNTLWATIASNTRVNDPTTGYIMEIDNQSGNLIHAHQSDFNTNGVGHLAFDGETTWLTENFFSDDGDIGLLQSVHDLENNCKYETAPIQLAASNVIDLRQTTSQPNGFSADVGSFHGEIEYANIKTDNPCCHPDTAYTEVRLCPGDVYSGFPVYSDTTITTNHLNQFGCDSVNVTEVIPNEPIQPILETGEGDCLFDSTRISVLNANDFTEISWGTDDSGAEIIIHQSGSYFVETTDLNGCKNSTEVWAEVSEPLELELVQQTIQSDPVDPNGAIEVLAGGGWPGYQYSWDDGQTGPVAENITGGTHCVTVTDSNGCMLSDCFELDAEFSVLNTRVETSEIQCHGDSTGSITVEIEDGYPDIDLIIQGTGTVDTLILPSTDTVLSFEELPSGNYTIFTRDQIGQNRLFVVEIPQPELIELIEYSKQQPRCHSYSDGQIEVWTTGGTGPLNHHWQGINTGSELGGALIDNLPEDIYQLTISDSLGCSVGPFEIGIIAPDPIEVRITHNNPQCEGVPDGWIEIEEASGGTPPFTGKIAGEMETPLPYFINELQPGSYFLTVEDAVGCLYFDSLELSFQHQYQLTISAESPIELGDTIPIQVTTDMPNIEQADWYPEHLLDYLSNSPLSPDAFPIEDTEYILYIVNTAGCQLSDSILIEVIPSPEEVYIPNAFSPNEDGINDRFTVYAGKDVAEIVELTVFNRWGSKVWTNRHFLPNDNNYGWDGYFNGQKVQPGIFTFYAEVLFKNHNVRSFSGEILVVE